MRTYILLFLCVILGHLCYGQSCATPIVVDFSKTADTAVTITGVRGGNCCAGSNCISFFIKVNPATDMINFDASQHTGASFYTINCGPLTPIGTPACISGLSTIQISFCKPGGNSVAYTITALRGITTSGSLNLRQGCSGTMSVNGFLQPSITWTSIYPGAAGAYNAYLSQTTGAASVTVTPQSGSPTYIDYKVSGIESTICTMIRNDTIRVYTFSPLTVAIAPANPLICPGTSVTLTASPVGGYPPYTYLWSNGATIPSITVSTAATYTVSVNDQITNCGAVPAQSVVTIINPVAPTVAPQTVCSGNTATLTATAPGGPYQWYDAATNGNLLSTNSSYTTPVLSNTTTYYLQTTNSGCTSTRTAAMVTVNPNPLKPNISSP